MYIFWELSSYIKFIEIPNNYNNIFALPVLSDNAYDPDVNAKQMWIDKTVINESTCLTFMDNGNGMTAKKLHQMLR